MEVRKMFVENLLKNYKEIKPLSKSSSSFSACYDFWVNVLFERTMRLFEWNGLDKKIPQKEIEIPLLMNGMCAMKHYEGRVTPFFANYAGEPTVFYDEWKSVSLRSPKYSDVLKVDEECTVIRNNALCNSMYPLVHRYAIILAHMEVSLVNTLINGRDSGGIPIASTEQQKKAIETYRDDLCNGRVGSILDPAFSGVQFIGVDKNTTLNIREIVECMENTLDSFYNAIGVRTSWNKKGNMIEEEVSANDSMVMLNIEDMLEARKRGAEDTNELFGTNITVEKTTILRYNAGGSEDGTNNSEENTYR